MSSSLAVGVSRRAKMDFERQRARCFRMGATRGRKCATFCMAHKQAQISLIAKARFLEFHVS